MWMSFCCTTQCIKQRGALQKLKIHFDLIPQQKYKNRSLPVCVTLSDPAWGRSPAPSCLLRQGWRRAASSPSSHAQALTGLSQLTGWGQTKPWTRLLTDQGRSWWMEPRALRKPFAAVWGRACFSSSSSRCSAGPHLGLASPCCCYIAILKVCMVIYLISFSAAAQLET